MTLNTGPAPRSAADVYTLSQILEDSPPRKYYLSRKACLGILRRARERGKPLPPQLEAALKAQAGLTVCLAPSGGSETNMASSVLCLNDQGGSRMDASIDVTGTLRAQMDGHPPCVVEPAYAVYENHGVDARYTGPHKVSPTLTARAGSGGNNLPLVEMFSRQRVDVFQTDDVASTESARQHKDATDLIYQETVGALTTSDSKGPNSQYVSQDKLVVEGPLLIRRLSPLECERLQGFPDNWTNLPGAADAPRYRALGNSVCIPCVEYVMRGMALALRAG